MSSFECMVAIVTVFSLYIVLDFSQRRRYCYRSCIRVDMHRFRNAYMLVIFVLYCLCVGGTVYYAADIGRGSGTSKNETYAVILMGAVVASLWTFAVSFTLELERDRLWCFRRSVRNASIKLSDGETLRLWNLCERAETLPNSMYIHIAQCNGFVADALRLADLPL